jgi:hypothetical protein
MKDISDSIKDSMLKAILYTENVEDLDRIVRKLTHHYPLFDGLLYQHAALLAEESGLPHLREVFEAAEERLPMVVVPEKGSKTTAISYR